MRFRAPSAPRRRGVSLRPLRGVGHRSRSLRLLPARLRAPRGMGDRPEGILRGARAPGAERLDEGRQEADEVALHPLRRLEDFLVIELLLEDSGRHVRDARDTCLLYTSPSPRD